MSEFSPFPESEQKAYLRRHHLVKHIGPYREAIGHKLSYFGLPSSQMYDVDLWKRDLGRITAVERDADVALALLRTATRIGVRSILTLLETDITQAARVLAADEDDAKLSVSKLAAPLAKQILDARSAAYDLFNIDLCGGFLYPDSRGESEYEKLMRYLVSFQSRHRQPFMMMVTFNTRDRGINEYRKFIVETLAFLSTMAGTDTNDIERYYLAKKVQGQPPSLRNLRFCVPCYLHKIASEKFEVRVLSQWFYKTFYHAVLFFEPRQGTGLLGNWPPPDEIKAVLNTPLRHVSLQDGEIILKLLEAPEVA